jgi:hypothetical protein
MDQTTISLGAEVISEATLAQLGVSLLILAIVSLVLKGVALYKAARLKDKRWFWILLIFNTAGVLPLIYLYIKRKVTA